MQMEKKNTRIALSWSHAYSSYLIFAKFDQNAHFIL
jgi:hypothetical protein